MNARLYVLMDVCRSETAFIQTADALIAGGADVIQLRDKTAADPVLLSRSRILKDRMAAAGKNVLLIMNDRPDLAMLAEADGVHLGQDDLPPDAVRKIAGKMLIGVSAHSIEQARQATVDGADYIGIGPVFYSETKYFSHVIGLDPLRQVAAEIAVPAFAIGGITRERLTDVLQTGIRRIAVSSAVVQSANPEQTAATWKQVIASFPL
ncbi:MAG: thiamine phosphate synthase [Planctomycetaceae bacterium]|jgi:thiamine-phosphate pyrophosphorylase|nr:thiamine phosphate synthase [Planctomycetaceae bacterium]